MSRARALLLNLALSLGALALLVALCEGTLRLFPRLLPKGSYGASHYSPELRTTVYGSPVIYNKLRFIEREPNSLGFLDVEHAREKPPGTLRVAFFGDSYVESLQVPLDQVFHRRLPRELDGVPLEALGLGMSGWGTLQALLAYEVLAPRFDVDVACYVFVENDLGDNDIEVQGVRAHRAPKVFATLAPPPADFSLVMRNPPETLSFGYSLGKWLQERLLLARLLWSRSSLLFAHGVAIESDRNAGEMTTRAKRVPEQNDLPSSWPPAYRERAQELGRRILRRFRDRARADDRHFFILYVPRGEAQLRGELGPADTWRPWLEATARELGIPLVDPSDALRRRMQTGGPVYDDHWTPAGHEVVSEVLSDYLERWLREQRG